jgi:hypothetical protein
LEIVNINIVLLKLSDQVIEDLIERGIFNNSDDSHSVYLQWVFVYSQFGGVILLKVSHEVTEIGYACNWHSVVHRDSDTWVKCVGSNLDDLGFFSFLDE